MKKTYVEKLVEDPENMRLFLQERAIIEATDLLEAALEERGVNRTEFARRLGKTKGWVTQLLDGEGSTTIRTIADAFAVLGLHIQTAYREIQISNLHSTLAVQVCAQAPSNGLPEIIVKLDETSMIAKTQLELT